MQVALQEAGASIHDVSVWDLYKQAVATKERNSVPAVGASIDRRCFEHLVQVYNDQTIRQLLCFCCAQSKTDVSTCRSSIGFRSTKWLLGIQPKTLLHNFSRSEFEQKFARPGTPLAKRGSTGVTNDLQAPDFTEWTMRIDPTAIDQFLHSKRMDSGPDSSEWEILELKKHELICCPEDVQCERTHAEKTLCLHCKVPICKTCQVLLESKKIVPTGLCNDNWIGYPQAWVYEVGVTWMERTVATPYWTGMTLFTVTSTQKRRHWLKLKFFAQPCQKRVKCKLGFSRSSRSTMEFNAALNASLSDRLPLAVLTSQFGQLHIHSAEALQIVLQSAVAQRVFPAASTADDDGTLVDGYSAREWAAYAHRKSSIASSVCRLNGALKKQLADNQSTYRTDPWLNAKLPAAHCARAADGVEGDAWLLWKPFKKCRSSSGDDNDMSYDSVHDVDETEATPRSSSTSQPSRIASAPYRQQEERLPVIARSFKGDWRALPADSWAKLHSAFEETAVKTEHGCESLASAVAEPGQNWDAKIPQQFLLNYVDEFCTKRSLQARDRAHVRLCKTYIVERTDFDYPDMRSEVVNELIRSEVAKRLTSLVEKKSTLVTHAHH